MSFTIAFDKSELNSILTNIASSDSLRAIVPDINTAFSLFNNTLERRVSELYKVPHSLSSVLQRGGVAKSGNSFTLTYTNKPIPLADYPFDNPEVKVKNSIPFGLKSGWVKYIKVNRANKVVSKIRRSGSPSLPRARTKYKKFYAPKLDKILVRLQDATWSTIPSEYNPYGVRAPIKELYGPSLSKLAGITYDKDKQIDAARDRLAGDVLDAIIRFEQNK